MRQNRSIPDAVVIPELGYPDVLLAAQWLCDKFGFRERLRIANHRIQLSLDGGAVVVTEHVSAAGPVNSAHSVLVRVEDVDAHYAKAAAAGVRMIRPPQSYPFGERQYTAEDLGGHVWTFSQTLEDIDPASWGGVLRMSRSLRTTNPTRMFPTLVVIAVLFFAGLWWLDLRIKQLWARQLNTLAALECPTCGQVFGQPVAVAAREAHLARCREAQRQHPTSMINFARSWPVRCAACAATCEFHYERLQLHSRIA